MLENLQWKKTNWTADSSFFELVTADDVVLARTWDSLNGGRVFLTSDQGASWTQSSAADTDIDIVSMVVLRDRSLLAATWDNTYRSTSGGKSWDIMAPTGVPAETALRSLVMIDSLLFAGTTGNLYKSSDDGNTWTEVKSGLPATATIFSLAGRGSSLFAGSDGGVFVSKDGGASWAEANAGLDDIHVAQLTLVGSRLFAVTLKGVFLSDDSGAHWNRDTSAIKGVNRYLSLKDKLLAATDGDGAFFSSDDGASWTRLGSGLPDGSRVWSLAADTTGLYAGTDTGIWRARCE